MNQKELRDLEEQCIQECAPTCTASCPVHVDVKAMLAEIARGDFTAALKVYRKTVPFPGIICRICDPQAMLADLSAEQVFNRLGLELRVHQLTSILAWLAECRTRLDQAQPPKEHQA